MRQRAAWILGGLLGLMACTGLMAPFCVPQNYASRHVPAKWREGRWETTDRGLQARELTEAECGPLPPDAWLDLPPQSPMPVLLDGPEDLASCFAREVAPRFARRIPQAPEPE